MTQWQHTDKLGIVTLIHDTMGQLKTVLESELEKAKQKANAMERIQKMRQKNGKLGR